jgi:hypothetical protein
MVESQSSFWAAVEVSPSENMTGNLWLSSETPFVNLEWFDSPSVDLSNGISTVTFEVTPDADLTNGYYMVEIRGFSNGLERTIPVTFTIFNGPPPPEIPPITYYSEDFNATESPTTQDTDSTSCMIWLTDNTIDVSACIEDTSEQAEEPSEEPNPDTDKTPEDGFTRSGIYLIAGIFCLLALAVVARKTE